MSSGSQYLFEVDGDLLIPTDLVRGPWDHGLQHGGAVGGALGWAAESAVESLPADGGGRFVLCRLTTEILRPVPAVPLRYRASIDRAGRRSRVVSASLWHQQTCVARASSQWARVRDVGSPAGPFDGVGVGAAATNVDPAVPRRPAEPSDPGAGHPGYPRPGFNCDVFELRCLTGSTEDPGPGIVWVRMVAELIAGVKPTPVHLMATVADLGNAVGWEPSPAGLPMINPDVTLQMFRYPAGAWVCLESSSRSATTGIGMVETRLWDGDGLFGRVLSTTMESTMPLAVDLAGPPTGGPAG